MDFTALEAFLCVARERSFSRAAARLHKTQPAISQAIRRLEEKLGDQLFDRSTKAPTLTQAGDVLNDYGERLLRLVEEAESAIQQLRNLRGGRVLVGANEAGIHSLLPLIEEYREQYPDVVIDIRRVHARQIATDVHQGTLDIGILTFEPKLEGLGIVHIGTDQLVLLVSPSHRLASRARIALDEIADESVIAHNDPSPLRDWVLKSFEDKNLEVKIGIAMPSLDAIKRAVARGLGVALLPRLCATTELEQGELVALRVAELSKTRRVSLVWREGNPSHAANAFAKMVRSRRLKTLAQE